MIEMLKPTLPNRREENTSLDRKADAPSQSFDAILGTLFQNTPERSEPMRNDPAKEHVAENNQKSGIDSLKDDEDSSAKAPEEKTDKPEVKSSEERTAAAETVVSPIMRNIAAASGTVAADSPAKANTNAKKLPHEQKLADKPTVQNNQKPDLPEALTQKKQDSHTAQLTANEQNTKKTINGNLLRTVEALPLAEKIHLQQPGVIQELNTRKEALLRPATDRRTAPEKKHSAMPEGEKADMAPVRRHTDRMTRKTALVEQPVESKPATQSTTPLQTESTVEKTTATLSGKQNQDTHREGNQFGTEQQIRRQSMAASAPESSMQRASFGTELKELIDSARISVRDGRNATMSIKMNPEDLGKLELTMGLEDGVLTARFTVESEEARELLSANLESMRERLGAEGLSVGQLFVDVRGGRERREAMQERIWQGPAHRTESVSEIYELADTVSDGHFNMVM